MRVQSNVCLAKVTVAETGDGAVDGDEDEVMCNISALTTCFGSARFHLSLPVSTSDIVWLVLSACICMLFDVCLNLLFVFLCSDLSAACLNLLFFYLCSDLSVESAYVCCLPEYDLRLSLFGSLCYLPESVCLPESDCLPESVYLPDLLSDFSLPV
ncbi:hypothetical protein Tco_1270914 [Tanacetum coccineum]